MIDVAQLTIIAGLVSVVVTAGATLWHKRADGPDASAQMVTASSLILAQLQERIAVLEERVEKLEDENMAYHRLFGPLPDRPADH